MRSSRLNFGSKLGIVALEEEQRRQEELENPAPEAPVEDNANSLETDLLEAGTDHADIEEVTDAVDDGLDTVEALESLREVVSNAGKAGGLDQHGAAAVRVALESLYLRVGANVGQATPALESFGGVGDRARATIALESDIKARVKQIFEKIKEAVKKAIAWVVELFNKIFGHAEKLEKRANGLLEQSSKLTGTPNEKSFKNARLVTALHLEGGKVPGNDQGVKRVAETIKNAYASYPAFLATLEKIAAGASEDKANDLQSLFSSDAPKLEFQGMKKVSNAAAAGYSVSPNTMVNRSDELPGGRALVIAIDPTDGNNTFGGMGPFDKNATAVKGEDVPVLDKAATQAVAKQVAAIAGQVRQGRDAVSKATKVKFDLIKYVEKAANKAGDAEAKGDLQASAAALRIVLKLVDKPFVELNTYAINTGKALCDQIEESIKAHGAKKAEKTDEKAAA